MSSLKMPTGLSFADAKKDAKRLSKKMTCKLSEAQDIVAMKHGRGSWSEVTRQAKANYAPFPFLSSPRDTNLKPVRTLNVLLGSFNERIPAFFNDEMERTLKSRQPVFIVRPPVKKEDEQNDLHRVIDSLLQRFPTRVRVVEAVECLLTSSVVVDNNGRISRTAVDDDAEEPLCDIAMNGALFVAISPETTLGIYDVNAGIKQLVNIKDALFVLEDANNLWHVDKFDEINFEHNFNMAAYCFDFKGEIKSLFGWSADDLKGVGFLYGSDPDGLIRITPKQIEFYTPDGNESNWRGKAVYTLDDKKPETLTPEHKQLLHAYDMLNLDKNMHTIKLRPKLLISRHMGQPRLNNYRLTIEIPKLNYQQEFKKFIRPYVNKFYVALEDPIYLQFGIFTWLEMDDEPLEVIYRWTTTKGLSVTHTYTAWLTESPHLHPDGITPLGHVYDIDEGRYSFNDHRMLINTDNLDLDDRVAVMERLRYSQRGQAGLSHFAPDGNWNATIFDEFESEQKEDPHLKHASFEQ